jgi:hypothetical protein
MTRSDRVATLEEAKAQFQKSWDAWKAWTKLEEKRCLEALPVRPEQRAENRQGESQQLQKDQVAFYKAERHRLSGRSKSEKLVKPNK